MSAPIEPVVKLFDADTDVEYKDTSTWISSDPIIDFGTVKAGDKSPVINLRLWNNKGGSEIASTMRDVEMFILDKNDSVNERIVKDGWLHAKCTSALNGGTEIRLNDTSKIILTAKDQTEGTIPGGVNTGLATDTANFAAISTFIQIKENILDAAHGATPFSLAVKYFFT